jgi:NADPH-dependent 2,4-dienoyl-CoA reductase/sulfur reductase-like enzyme
MADTSTPERLVVIGGDAAGMTAASQAMRVAAEGSLEVEAFEMGPRTSWSACGLPYYVEGLVEDPDALVVRTPEEFEERGIRVHTSHEVEQIDLAAKTISVRDLTAEPGALATRTVAWDKLFIGTGATGIRPPLDGIDADGILEIRTIDDALEIDHRIQSGARSAVVVGAGYIGIEMAEALRERGLDVSVIEMADEPMERTLDPDMSALLSKEMTDHDIHMHFGVDVEGFRTDSTGAVTAAIVDPAAVLGGEVPCDLVVLGLGIKPNVSLAESAGIEIGQGGGIVVDERMQTSAADVYAGGDCVESLNMITGESAVVALGTHANRQGRIAGTNIGGGDQKYRGVLGTAITKFCDLEIGRTGLTMSEAREHGIAATATIAQSRTKSRYYPGADRVTLKLIHRTEDGRIIGGQIVGGTGSGKRIDVIATAIWNSMTVHDLAVADLSYAPPFSPVWDPVSFAAGLAAEERS